VNVGDELYADPWLRIDLVEGVRGDGTRYPHRRVVSGIGHGALVVPVVDGLGGLGSRRMVLVQQARPAAGLDLSWEFPRGRTDDAGSEEAARELAEETGLVPVALEHLGTLSIDTGLLGNTVGIWLAILDEDSLPHLEQHLDPESCARPALFPEQVVKRMLCEGKIRCAMTAAALALLG